MGSESVKVSKSGSILHVEFNRPDKKNALTREMYNASTEALKEAKEDGDTRVVLFSGAGGNFTSGNDVIDFMQEPPTGTDSPVFHFLMELVHFPKPVVSAVHGVAVGLGTTMLLHCDLAYAGESAMFQMPFTRLGLCPEAGSSLLVPQMVGHVRAVELLLLGEKFNAATAKECGFVNQVCADDALLDRAFEQANKLAELPPSAVRLTKALMKQGKEPRLSEMLQTEGDHFMERLTSPEAAEAFTAFAERRKPDFSQFK